MMLAEFLIRFFLANQSGWLYAVTVAGVMVCLLRPLYAWVKFPFRNAVTPGKRRYLLSLYFLFAAWSFHLMLLSFEYRVTEGVEFFARFLGMGVLLLFLAFLIFFGSAFGCFPCSLYVASRHKFADAIWCFLIFAFVLIVGHGNAVDFSGPVLSVILAYVLLSLRAGIVNSLSVPEEHCKEPIEQ